jgi:hypothetical protein
MSRLHHLFVENFKRIELIDITLDGPNLLQITGRNRQGKTSAIDAIMAALGGARCSPAYPVRTGTDGAVARVQLDDMVVERKWNEQGKTTLTVTSLDGARYQSPQNLLDRFLGDLTFDPIKFRYMPVREQAKTLRQLAGLDFTELDGKRVKLAEDRAVKKKELAKLKAAHDAIVSYGDAPKAKIDISALMTQSKEINARVTAWNDSDKEYKRVCQDQVDLLSEIEVLENSLKVKREKLIGINNRLTTLEDSLCEAKPDTKEIDQLLNQAQGLNDKWDANLKKKAAHQAWFDAEDEGLDIDAAITKLDQSKRQQLETAKYPVPGLTVDDDTVMYRGLPLDQASQSEGLIVTLAISAALNPKLKLLLVKDTPMLDEESIRTIAAFAEENDCQVIMERAADPNAGIGIVIEEGRVLEMAG